jgi:hypothetical protein
VISDEHYPPRDDADGEHVPKAASTENAAFLALGPENGKSASNIPRSDMEGAFAK